MNLLYYLALVGFFYLVFFVAYYIFNGALKGRAEKQIGKLEDCYKESIENIRQLAEKPESSFDAEKYIKENEDFKKTEELIQKRKDSLAKRKKIFFTISLITIPITLLLILIAILNNFTVYTKYYVAYLYATIPFIPAITIIDTIDYLKERRLQRK